ncbi:MAG TPA: hypothetical protein PLP57_07195 [Candidatus Saccharicenans sp.]|jgi:hypothetical protein|nr:hypothetical protein [Candidatus Saccharicenans sp.]HRD02411.1 hypothetical protein [Candidatus Saccharicenans sp.]
MPLKEIRGQRFLWLAIVLMVFMAPGLKTQANLHGESNLNQASTWEFGLRFDLFNRGTKWDQTTSTLKALNLMAEARGKNLGGTVDLNLFAGLGSTDLNGVVFSQLPITLDYQAGRITGLVVGLGADWPLIYASDFRLGLTADFMTWIGFNKKFAIEGFVFPGEAKAEPDWAQASGGIFAAYEGYENVEPFFDITVSALWGTFNMTENIQDLSGEEEKKIKGSGLLSISLGCHLKLTEKLYLTPVARFYPASKFGLAGSLGLYYAF